MRIFALIVLGLLVALPILAAVDALVPVLFVIAWSFPAWGLIAGIWLIHKFFQALARRDDAPG